MPACLAQGHVEICGNERALLTQAHIVTRRAHFLPRQNNASFLYQGQGGTLKPLVMAFMPRCTVEYGRDFALGKSTTTLEQEFTHREYCSKSGNYHAEILLFVFRIFITLNRCFRKLTLQSAIKIFECKIM